MSKSAPTGIQTSISNEPIGKDPAPAPKPAARSRKSTYIDPMPTLDLNAWIRDNQRLLKPPVSNKQLLSDSKDAIVFVSGGPNTRNDFHVNPTEEIFYQLKGDIAVRVRPLDGTPPRDVVIKEGDLFLLPRFVPHRPQRPAGTLGLVIEFPRGADAEGKPQMDGLRWYCPTCDTLVHEASWVLKKIDEDLKIIMEEFWNGPIERRSCRRCGHVIQRAGAIELKDGFVKSAGAKPKPATPKPATPKPADKPLPLKPAATDKPAASAKPSSPAKPAIKSSPAKPITKPTAKPAAKPAAKPQSKSTKTPAKASTKPASKSPTKSLSKSPAKPVKKSKK